MKEASRILYIIGRVFNIISLVCQALGIVGGFYAAGNSTWLYNELVAAGVENVPPVQEIYQASVSVVFGCVIGLGIAIAIHILVSKAIKAVEENKPNKKLHIAMIVLGAMDNLFCLLGGVFALSAIKNISQTQEPEQQKPVVIEIDQDKQ